MAAPSYTARGSLAGHRPLKDGYQALLTLSADSDILIWEKSVTPPGQEGGDPIDQTTMHNATWRTLAPRALITLTECQLTGAYNPQSYSQIQAQLNVEQVISILFSSGNWMAFYGFIRNFQPAAMVEGTQPEATFTVVPTNWDPNANTEEGPAYGTAS